MSISTTLTLSPVSSADNLQRLQLYQNQHHYQRSNSNSTTYTLSNSKNYNNTNSSFYQYPALVSSDDLTNIGSNEYIAFATKDSLLLEKSKSAPATLMLLQTSSSCNAIIKPKSTILIQDNVNGRVNTSLTDSESDYGATVSCGDSLGNSNLDESTTELCGEQDAFLGGGIGSGSRRSTSSRSHGKSKSNICYRAHSFITRNWFLSYLVPLSILLALMFVAYLTRDYAKRMLYWIETQNPWVIFAIFMLLFILVSFPVVVGYFVLMITSGYLFGFVKGFPTVILGANMGIAIAHVTLRSLRHRIPMHRIIKNETGRAILRVISGPRAFKVVLFTRLTPIPFGIQNAIFGVSSINPRIYHTATFLGLLPAQTINVYLGSTLRSMHEVLNNHGTALTGYISFGVEVICGVALMFWVVQKARKELSETLLSDCSSEGKLIDIQV